DSLEKGLLAIQKTVDTFGYLTDALRVVCTEFSKSGAILDGRLTTLGSLDEITAKVGTPKSISTSLGWRSDLSRASESRIRPSPSTSPAIKPPNANSWRFGKD